MNDPDSGGRTTFDVEPGLGEDRRGHHAARAGADDDHVRGQLDRPLLRARRDDLRS